MKLFVTNLIGPCVVNLLTQISSSCASLCGPCAVKLFVTYPSERHRRLKCWRAASYFFSERSEQLTCILFDLLLNEGGRAVE